MITTEPIGSPQREIAGADLVIAMEDIHVRKMLAIAPGSTNISLLTDYDPDAEPGLVYLIPGTDHRQGSAPWTPSRRRCPESWNGFVSCRADASRRAGEG